MKVRQLIEKLKTLDQDKEIYIRKYRKCLYSWTHEVDVELDVFDKYFIIPKEHEIKNGDEPGLV